MICRCLAVTFTTTVAHSSGVWLSSERPASGISETAPLLFRLGDHDGGVSATGTSAVYARWHQGRRHLRCTICLSQCTSIAGEDDLDAPGLA
jgi:hypothetical protein